MCDEAGHLIDGDDVMAMAALDMLEHNQLADRTLVATVMSNAGLDVALQKAGGRIVRIVPTPAPSLLRWKTWSFTAPPVILMAAPGASAGQRRC